MAQRITNSFINTNRPGAYFDIKVKSTPVGVGSSGNIVIVGEASGGAAVKGIDPANGDILKDNFFTPDQLDRVSGIYISGPIVDAFRALTSPSSDTNITGSANRIFIAKTNAGSKASAAVDTAYGTLRDKNWGVDGNKYSYLITQSIDELGPAVTGSTITANLGASLDNAEFTIRENGGVETVVTLSGTAGDHDTITKLVAEVDPQLPSGLSASEGAGTDQLTISADSDAAANSKGFGKAFELIDSSPADLALFGHAEGVTWSSAEPEVQLDINRQDTGTNESFLANAAVALRMGYEGTTAVATITDTSMAIVVTGGAGANLTIDLSEFTTLSELSTFINSQTGYSALDVPTASQKAPAELDDGAFGICSTGAGEIPGRIKRAAAAFADAAGQSAVLNFSATAAAGLPDIMSNARFLAGGLRGETLSADVVEAIFDLESINVNFVNPLFSRDASADIADGLTDPASTYTIDAINALVKNHVLKMSTAKIKKHRLGFSSYWNDNFSEAESRAGQLANARMSLAMQRSTQVNSTGEVVNYLPWHTACIASGMQAGGFFRSITNKFANVISFQDPSGFDSGSPGDIERAIDSGLLFLEKAVVGNKWVVDQTTYGLDTNFVFNSIQAMYAADLVALDLAASFQTAFVGQSLAEVDAATALSFLASKMDAFKKQKLIAASDDAPLGFKNAKVSISGPVMEVSVEIKLATALLFIPINIEISQIQNEAS